MCRKTQNKIINGYRFIQNLTKTSLYTIYIPVLRTRNINMNFK